MIDDKKIVVVMPAYNAEKTLLKTYNEIDFTLVDEVVLVDDNSTDQTIRRAKEIGVKHIVKHDVNKGYGGNQKSCYKKALELGADYIVMIHPDYQYTPKLIPTMVHMMHSGLYECVIGSRILGKGAINGGMPKYKYVANRFLTLFQNLLMNQKLSEYHTGYRAFTKEVIDSVKIEENSDDFVFDNQMLAQVFMAGYEIAEVTCPTKYFDDASSINLARSTTYGLGVLKTSLDYALHKRGWKKSKLF